MYPKGKTAHTDPHFIETTLTIKDNMETRDEAAAETTSPVVTKENILVEKPQYVRKTGKISKKEGKKLATGNKKV